MTRIPICVFAKPPVVGKVKTRLAYSIGAEPAASLASAMLCDVWSIISTVSRAVPVLAAAEEGCFPVTVPAESFWLQGPGELGAQIENILRRALSNAPAAIALGADSPLISARHIENALDELSLADAVIGPSRDGGFYLLGVQHCPCGLLENLPWSTAETGEQTCERLRRASMAVCELETLLDVDTPDDVWVLYNELNASPPEIAPATRRWFHEHRFADDQHHSSHFE